MLRKANRKLAYEQALDQLQAAFLEKPLVESKKLQSNASDIPMI